MNLSELADKVSERAESLGYAKARLEIMEILANAPIENGQLIIQLMAWVKKQ